MSRSTLTQAAVLVLGMLLASPPRAAAQCTHEEVESGGTWVYLKDASQGGDWLSITLVNLTDYLLYNSATPRADHWMYTNFQDPFGARPVKVMDINDDGVLEEGVPPYSSVTWKSSEASSPTPQHYQGTLVLELRGYTTSSGSVLPNPAWPNKFRVSFTPQDAKGWLRDFNDNMAGDGTWIALRPDVPSAWEERNRFRSGVWTTPLSPADPHAPAPGDDFETRNIMTIANRSVVVTLYDVRSWHVITPEYHMDLNHNIVIAVRQTNWVGPDVPTDASPVAGMDDYAAQKLDWRSEPSHALPRNDVPRWCNWP